MDGTWTFLCSPVWVLAMLPVVNRTLLSLSSLVTVNCVINVAVDVIGGGRIFAVSAVVCDDAISRYLLLSVSGDNGTLCVCCGRL